MRRVCSRVHLYTVIATLVCTHGTATLTNSGPSELVEEHIFHALQVRIQTVYKKTDRLKNIFRCILYCMAGNFRGKSKKALKINFHGFKFRDSNQSNMTQIASLLPVGTVFIGLCTLVYTFYCQ